MCFGGGRFKTLTDISPVYNVHSISVLTKIRILFFALLTFCLIFNKLLPNNELFVNSV